MKDIIGYTPQIGDIILQDSNKFGPKCVKFLMQSPTVWHQLYRWLSGTLKDVQYYHVAMIINTGFSGFSGQADVIEQQTKVELNDWNKDRTQIIFRKMDLTTEDIEDLKQEALSDTGQKYDVLNCFGKLLTWLTGIKWFARYMESKDKDICVNRVCKWYWDAVREHFNAVTHSELTTRTLYRYLLSNDIYKIVYIKTQHDWSEDE